jgi:5-hydroxyisourate hydrolase-like protein (transthyretin family)
MVNLQTSKDANSSHSRTREKPLLCVIMTVLLASLASGQVRSQEPAKKRKQETCTVSGMVVKLDGSAPLKSAIVRLNSAEDRTHAYAATTDADGRFALKNVEPGHYRLTVTRSGFADQEYGQKTPNDPGSILTLAPGRQVNDLLFRLIPWAIIAGRIRNEDGEPLPWVHVTALREAYTDGKRKLSPSAQEATNDLGEYRLFGLRPGRYFVSATYSTKNQMASGNEEMDEPAPVEESSAQRYVPTYYPGTPDPAKAATITVKSGDEIPSVDILLQRVAAYKIRGRIFNMITHRPGKDVSIMMLPRNTQVTGSVFNFEAAVLDKDGSFVLNDILPGSYTLSAFWFDEGKPYVAKQNIDVGNADVEGVTLTIAPGVTVNGRVNWDGKPSLEGDELSVSPSSSEQGMDFGDAARVAPNGAFTLKDISEDTYHLSVNGMSKDCYIKAIRYGTADALYDGFAVQRGTDASLELTLSSRGARVQGAITDADGLPVAGVWVVLVPEEAHRGQMQMYKETTTDQYGRFELRGISPGDYKLFSWEEVENGAWQDPEFLKPFESKGEEIKLQEGDSKSVNLVAIRTASPEKQKP